MRQVPTSSIGIAKRHCGKCRNVSTEVDVDDVNPLKLNPTRWDGDMMYHVP